MILSGTGHSALCSPGSGGRPCPGSPDRISSGQRGYVGTGLPPQICADGTETTSTLQTLAEGLLAEAGDAELEASIPGLRLPWRHFRRGFRRRELPRTVVLDLTRGADALFKEFSKDRRRNIRLADKHGLEVRGATTGWDIFDARCIRPGAEPSERRFTATGALRTSRRPFALPIAGGYCWLRSRARLLP
jgi:hypothetical protein